MRRRCSAIKLAFDAANSMEKAAGHLLADRVIQVPRLVDWRRRWERARGLRLRWVPISPFQGNKAGY
jgi:hypothetical protein